MDLQQSFDTTAKVLFGQPIGKLSDFRDYLGEMVLPYQTKKSFLSGKQVMVSHRFYPKDAKFISQEEIAQLKFQPLSINEIKDIDSLLCAVSERAIYCGNKLLGENTLVQGVDNCVDCNHVEHSHNVFSIKYGAYLSCLRECEHVFGVFGFPRSSFSMRCFDGIGTTRCFESYYSRELADTYYAFNCVGCSDCIFAFNLRGKRHTIGNLELPKDSYLELKKKLVFEMGAQLKKNKRLFSVVDIAYAGRDRKTIKEDEVLFDSPVPQKVEEAFRKTTKLVLGKELQGIKQFEGWLQKCALTVKKIKGALGTPTYKVDGLPFASDIPADRLLTLGEALSFSEKNKISLKAGESLSLHETLLRVAKIARFSLEFIDGCSENCVDVPTIFTGFDSYKTYDITHSKYSAYASVAVHSEYIFGGHLRMLYSQFCINCFDSTKLNSCFEVDCSYSCRNCLFCHNCENLSDCMFCFNAKNLRYAIGNVEVGREGYMRIKGILLAHIQKELEEKKRLGLNIFNSGAKSAGSA